MLGLHTAGCVGWTTCTIKLVIKPFHAVIKLAALVKKVLEFFRNKLNPIEGPRAAHLLRAQSVFCIGGFFGRHFIFAHGALN